MEKMQELKTRLMHLWTLLYSTGGTTGHTATTDFSILGNETFIYLYENEIRHLIHSIKIYSTVD